MSAVPKLALCGYGRFGEALGKLALESGFQVAAFDPSAAIPDSLRATSVEALCESADNVLICTPLETIESSLTKLKPHLTSSHLVLDVGSVKLEPVETLRKLLGEAHAWVGSHPLFGPTSLARGERPLRVVLCGGAEAAQARAAALWTKLGCEPFVQTPEAHDRAMARSHALAFFLAKGLLDIRAGEGAAFTPPSFEAIGKTISAVRSDAGHLFRSIQNRNPFASEERARLIAALTKIDQALGQPSPSEEVSAHEASELVNSPEPDESPSNLLAELDAELQALLERRALLEARLAESERARES